MIAFIIGATLFLWFGFLHVQPPFEYVSPSGNTVMLSWSRLSTRMGDPTNDPINTSTAVPSIGRSIFLIVLISIFSSFHY